MREDLLFTPPNFSEEKYASAKDVTTAEVTKDGVSPKGFYLTSHMPTYYKVDGSWQIPERSSQDCVAVVEDGKVFVREFRNLKKGDKVVVGRKEDGSEGIYVYTEGFVDKSSKEEATFGFREGRSRETAFSKDYDELYEILKYEKENNGYVTWVLGTATSLDEESDDALARLVENGYANAIFCGTAAVAYDLERAKFKTVEGQEEYLNSQNTRENFYEVINRVNEYGSIKEYVEKEGIETGFVAAAIRNNVNLVIAGTIRDRYTFNDTYNNVYEAQDEMRRNIKQSSTVIMSSAILFTIATGNMTPSYNEINGEIRPVFMYTVDIQEFAVNKLSDRGTLTAKTMVTNSQDFVKNIDRNLNQK